MSLENFVVGGVLFGSAFLLIIVLLVGVKIKENISLSTRYNPADYDDKRGTVKSCSVSSSTSTGNGYNKRITSIVYLVMLDIDGVEYSAYSREFYNDGDILHVLLKRNGKTVKILGYSESASAGERTKIPVAPVVQPIKRVSDYKGYSDEEYGDEGDDDEEYDDEPEDEYETDESEAEDESYAATWEDVMRQYVADRVGTSADEQNSDDAALEDEADEQEHETAQSCEPEQSDNAAVHIPESPKPFEHTASAHDVRQNRPNVGYKGIKRK